jgi:hypothetical protein
MNEDVRVRLEILKENYSQNIGQPFNYFFCPMLYKDENKPLCKAHIVNEAFPNSARAWTVQREDIDSFYGSKFESDFTVLQHSRKYFPDEIFCNKHLSKQIRPQILLNDNPVDYYYTDKEVPKKYSKAIIETNGSMTNFALKMPPEVVIDEVDSSWSINISKDVRLSALVSLVKSAHLTLFDMLGYNYAMSAGGNFIGYQILGKFFKENYNKPRKEVLKNALPFFKEFTHLVRPMTKNDLGFEGTISDNQLLACIDSNNNIWALIIFIRTDQNMHSILVPVFESTESIPIFLNFLNNENENLMVKFCRFRTENWEISKKSINITWPKKGILYPKN